MAQSGMSSMRIVTFLLSSGFQSCKRRQGHREHNTIRCVKTRARKAAPKVAKKRPPRVTKAGARKKAGAPKAAKPQPDDTVDESTLIWRSTGATPAETRKALAAILGRPAARDLLELGFAHELDRALVQLLSQRARTVRKLSCETGGNLGALAMPSLELLEVWLGQAIDAGTYGPLLSAGGVPALRRLDFIKSGDRKLIPIAFLEALLASKLLRQLEWLAFRQECLSDAGVKLLLEHRDALAHLRGVFVASVDPDLQNQIVEVFGVQGEARPMIGKRAGRTLSIASHETWPSPSKEPSIANCDAEDLEQLRHAPADVIEAYWKGKARELA